MNVIMFITSDDSAESPTGRRRNIGQIPRCFPRGAYIIGRETGRLE